MRDGQFSLGDDFPPVPLDEWLAQVERDLAGKPFETLVTRTYDGIRIEPLYTSADWPGREDRSGFPGSPPFTRGANPVGNAAEGWDIRQEHAHPDLRETRDAVASDLSGGATSVLLRLDAAARSGLSPGTGAAEGSLGAGGLMAYCRDDLDEVLAGADLHEAAVALDAGGAFLPGAAMLTALWRNRGVPDSRAAGSFEADPLATLARDGALPCPLDRALEQLADLAAWTADHLPRVTAARVDTSPYHDAGATAALDLALSMATGLEYLRAMTGAGLDVKRAAAQLTFVYSVGSRFFLGTAKLRAARTLWSRILEVCAPGKAPSPMRLAVRPGQRVLTVRDPWVNILRNTVCCFAGALAGAATIIGAPLDAAIGLPGPLGRRLARTTQLILRDESSLHRVADPAGGSWMLEQLTEKLVEAAWKLLQETEREGGMASALKGGWVARTIEPARSRRERNVARRSDPIIGVSEFPRLDEEPLECERPDLLALRDAAVKRSAARLEGDALRRGLGDLEIRSADATRTAGSLTAAAVAAASANASIGEIAAAIGMGNDPEACAPLAPNPLAGPFEALRSASDAHLSRTGSRPRVFLASIGPIAAHTARAAFSKNFFEAGGFEVLTHDGFPGADDAARAFGKSGAAAAVICAADETLASITPEVSSKLRAEGARRVLLAAASEETASRQFAQGVDQVIYPGCDAVSILRDLLAHIVVL